MTKKIIVPGWKKLSDEEKKLAEDCISSILSARQASITLLKLLSQNHATPEFIARLEEFSNQQDDFEIVASATELEVANFITNNDVDGLCEFICHQIVIAGVSKQECMKVCQDRLS